MPTNEGRQHAHTTTPGEESERRLVREVGPYAPGTFFLVPNAALEGLSLSEVGLYCHLKRITGEGGGCFMSRRRLAERCGVTEKTLRKLEGSLEAKGMIQIERQGGDKGLGDRPNLVTILPPKVVKITGGEGVKITPPPGVKITPPIYKKTQRYKKTDTPLTPQGGESREEGADSGTNDPVGRKGSFGPNYDMDVFDEEPPLPRPDTGSARRQRERLAADLLKAFWASRHPSLPLPTEAEARMYRPVLNALIDSGVTPGQVAQATEAALERFGSPSMVTPASVARNLTVLLAPAEPKRQNQRASHPADERAAAALRLSRERLESEIAERFAAAAKQDEFGEQIDAALVEFRPTLPSPDA